MFEVILISGLVALGALVLAALGVGIGEIFRYVLVGRKNRWTRDDW